MTIVSITSAKSSNSQTVENQHINDTLDLSSEYRFFNLETLLKENTATTLLTADLIGDSNSKSSIQPSFSATASLQDFYPNFPERDPSSTTGKTNVIGILLAEKVIIVKNITNSKSDTAQIIENQYIEETLFNTIDDDKFKNLFTLLKENTGNLNETTASFRLNFSDSISNLSADSKFRANINFDTIFSGTDRAQLDLSASIATFNIDLIESSSNNVYSESNFLTEIVGESTASTTDVTAEAYPVGYITSSITTSTVNKFVADSTVLYGGICLTLTKANAKVRTVVTDIRKMGGYSESISTAVSELEEA